MVPLRASMPALLNKQYFNYGGQGPLPNESLEAIFASWREIQKLGPFTNSVWPYISKEIESTRQLLASLCGVPPKRLAFTENVTGGCILPIWGLPFSAGDRLLLSDCEHPGVVAACKELARRQNLSIDILKVQQFTNGYIHQQKTNIQIQEQLESSLHKKTRLVVLSHLLWNTGQLMPISDIAKQLSTHPNKPFLLVDAAQSFGQLPVEADASVSDIYAFTGHKWACGPEGLGGVAISERVLEESNPTLIGWRALQDENMTTEGLHNHFHQDSRRFEIATSCVPLLAGLRCSLRLLEKEGSPKQRHSKILLLSSILWEKLHKTPGVATLLKNSPPGGLISFSLAEKYSTKEIVNLLGKQQLWVRDLTSPRCLRACVHITTLEKEIEALSQAISNISDRKLL